MALANQMFSAFSFIGIVLCCIPLPRYAHAWNIGIFSVMAWSALGSLNYFINSIIWNDSLDDPSPVWCDISGRISIASPVALPMAILCAVRTIYLITRGKVPSNTTQMRHALTLDLVLIFGIPVIVTILLYIPQEARYAVYEDFGCLVPIDNSFVGNILGLGPPLMAAVISAVYSALTILHLYKRYSELNELLSTSNTIDMTQYVRIIILTSFASIVILAMALYALFYSLPMQPWLGWKKTHSNFSQARPVYPTSVWRSSVGSAADIEVDRWQFVFSCFVNFVFFGLHKEACKKYASALKCFIQCIPCLQRIKISHILTTDGGPGLPSIVFDQKPSPRKLKFLDFSPNKTRVIVDMGGGLPQTVNSISTSMTTSSV